MELKDLEAGKHLVKLRSGKTYIVVYSSYSESLFLMSNDSYTDLDNYKSDFTHREFSSLDIVEVSNISHGVLDGNSSCDMLWEESSVQKFSSQIQDIENLLRKREYRTNQLQDELKELNRKLNEASNLTPLQSPKQGS